MSTPTELFLVRHGEAYCNQDQFVGGPLGCTGLTPNGRDQVQERAELFADLHRQRPFAAFYASPLRRTWESAEILGEGLGIWPKVDEQLREQDYGSADGQPWVDVVSRFGGIPALEPDRPIAPGAETWTRYHQRATKALQRVLDRHVGQRILIVGHGETIDASFRLFLGLDAASRASVGFAARPASLTHWMQHPASLTRPGCGWRWVLCLHNSTATASRDGALIGS